LGEELKGRNAFALVLILALSLLVPFFTIPKSNATAPGVYLSINPSMYIAQAKGETFTLDVEIANAANLSSCQFTVTYNTSLLKVIQVLQGSFFPLSSPSHFSSEINNSKGTVKVNCSIDNPANSTTGSGTLASITFEVIQNPNWCADGRPIKLTQTVLLDSRKTPIVHDAVGAVYFWKTLEPDPPVGGRLLDVYTQRGGSGQGQPDGNFTFGEEVQLISDVTYNGQPVQQKLVAFQVLNSLSQTVILRTAITDQNGRASISFKIPNVFESLGTWKVISVVEIAEEIAWDIVTFGVISVTPVGGYSISKRGASEANPWASYQMILMALSIFLIAAKPRGRRIRSSTHDCSVVRASRVTLKAL
jgi:hypothetical protein